MVSILGFLYGPDIELDTEVDRQSLHFDTLIIMAHLSLRPIRGMLSANIS